jgi:hypothetical protein
MSLVNAGKCIAVAIFQLQPQRIKVLVIIFHAVMSAYFISTNFTEEKVQRILEIRVFIPTSADAQSAAKSLFFFKVIEINII